MEDGPRYKLASDVEIPVGGSVILTLEDSHVLSDPCLEGLEGEELVLRDSRASELAKYKKNARERERIKEYQATAGPTGVGPSVFNDEIPPEPKFDEEFGQPMPIDSSFYRISGTAGSSLAVNGVGASAADPAAEGSAVAGSPAGAFSAKFKNKKLPEKRRREIDWDDVFGDTEESKDESKVEEPDRKEAAVVRKWGLAAAEDSGEADLMGLLIKPELQDEPFAQVKEEPDEPKVEEVLSAADDSGYRTEFGAWDIRGGISSTIHISATSEFISSVLTPLERLEEKRSTAQEILEQRRAVISSSSTKKKDALGQLEVLEPETDLVAQVMEDKPLDMGIASALQHMRKRGDLDPDKPKLGRLNREMNRPVHKDLNDPDDIKIEYTDEHGRVLNRREAFRQLSQAFHRIKPGKKKQEKLLRKLALERKLKTGNPEQVLPTLKALKIVQSTQKTPYLRLTGGPDTTK